MRLCLVCGSCRLGLQAVRAIQLAGNGVHRLDALPPWPAHVTSSARAFSGQAGVRARSASAHRGVVGRSLAAVVSLGARRHVRRARSRHGWRMELSRLEASPARLVSGRTAGCFGVARRLVLALLLVAVRLFIVASLCAATEFTAWLGFALCHRVPGLVGCAVARGSRGACCGGRRTSPPVGDRRSRPTEVGQRRPLLGLDRGTPGKKR